MININKFKNIISNLDNYRNIGKTLPEINGIRFNKVFASIHNVFDDDYTMQFSDKYIKISDITGNVIVSKLISTGFPDIRQYIHTNDNCVICTVDNGTIKDFKYLLTGAEKVKKALIFDGDIVSCGNVSVNGYNRFKDNKVGVNCRYVLECLNVIKGEVKISRFKNMIKISNDDVTEQICEIKLK